MCSEESRRWDTGRSGYYLKLSHVTANPQWSHYQPNALSVVRPATFFDDTSDMVTGTAYPSLFFSKQVTSR